MPKLSIIIPAYNEEKTIHLILDKVKAVSLLNGMEKEVIIVNDCSKDNTETIVKNYIADNPSFNIQYLKHDTNQGKGMAIRTGLNAVSGEYVIIQDADLEYDPCDYNIILKTAVEKKLPTVYGSRFLNKNNKHSYQRFYLGGRIVTLVTNILFQQRLTDEPTCYKLFDSKFIKAIPLKCKRFEFCPEVTAKVAKLGIKIKEVPISYNPRSFDEGKKITWKDGVEAIWILLKYRFSNG